MTTPSTLKLTRYLRSREEPLANLWAVDDAFIRAGMRGGATVKWETIRAGLSDVLAIQRDAHCFDTWTKARQRRLGAVLRRARALRAGILVRDPITIVKLACFVFPYTDIAAPGPSFLYVDVPRFTGTDLSGLTLLIVKSRKEIPDKKRVILATKRRERSPDSRAVLVRTPPLDVEGTFSWKGPRPDRCRILWDGFMAWLRHRYSLEGPTFGGTAR